MQHGLGVRPRIRKLFNVKVKLFAVVEKSYRLWNARENADRKCGREKPLGKMEVALFALFVTIGRALPTKEYLKGSLTCEAFLRMNEYEECFFEQAVGAERSEGVEVSMARMKQFEIRHFILGMGNSREKLLLYYHYIRGDSVEQCAELVKGKG